MAMRKNTYRPTTECERCRLAAALAEARMEAVRVHADMVRAVRGACRCAGLSMDQIQIILDAATEYKTWHGFSGGVSRQIAAG